MLGNVAYAHAGAVPDMALDGALAVLRMHDGALSAADVQMNFNAEAVRFGREPIVAGPPVAARPFPPRDVRLLDSPFRDAMNVDLRYLLMLEPDRLLARFRTSAGLPAKAEHYHGWEDDATGHTLGHYLSACARMYAATGDARVLARVNYLVDELDACQRARTDGYVGAVPNGDKVFAEIRAGQITAFPAIPPGKWVCPGCWTMAGRSRSESRRFPASR